MVLSKDEADHIVHLPKSIGEPIRWRLHQRKHQRYRFDVRVIAPDFEGSLRLAGTASPEKWSFVLLGPNNERLRKISTPHSGHLHPDLTEADPRHKHYWAGDDEDWWTYVPDDIRWESPNTALIDFVRECHIVLMHEAPVITFQTEMTEG